MRNICSLALLVVFASQSLAQDGWHAANRTIQLPPPQQMIQLPPAQQQVQVQVGQPMPSSAPSPLTPPTYEGWRDGFRETWQHEFRPLRNEYNTNCYQTQNQYVYPQQQYPQYQCYQQPIYYQQPVYYYRRPCSIWPW